MFQIRLRWQATTAQVWRGLGTLISFSHQQQLAKRTERRAQAQSELTKAEEAGVVVWFEGGLWCQGMRKK